MWGRNSLIGVLKGSAADMNRTGRIEVGCLLDNRVCPRGDRHMTSCLVCWCCVIESGVSCFRCRSDLVWVPCGYRYEVVSR